MSRTTLLTALCAASLACAAQPNDTTPDGNSTMAITDSESNEKIIRRLFQECIDGNEPELFGELIAEEYVGPRGDTGPAAFREPIDRMRTAFPDIRFVIEEVMADGDRVALRWSWSGTHRGPFVGVAPTNHHVVNDAIGIFRLRDGKVVAASLQTDRLGFWQQIGLARDLPVAPAPRR